ncbi:MAG: PAS domain S-box protein [Sediminibacterium sp.]
MLNKLKILLLEDDPEDVDIIRHIVEASIPGIEYYFASTRHTYMDVLSRIQPDCILADNSVTGMNAATALATAREQLPDVPFIMVTGAVPETYAIDMIKAGADDYIIKDRLQRLPAAIEAAVNKYRAGVESRKNVEKLRENEEKYRTLIERVSDGFIALNSGWQFEYANKKAEQLMGHSSGSLVGKNIWEEFPDAIDGPFYKAYHTAMDTQQNAYVKAYSDAVDRWLVCYIYPSHTGLSIYFVDITEQKKAEARIRESEEKYRELVERITDAFIALDKNFCYTYVNRQAGELLHRGPSELVGKNVWEVFPDAVGSETHHSFLKAMNEQVYVCCTDYYEPLGLWQENHIYPSPEGLSVFIRDITEAKKAEQTMLSMEKEIMHQQIQEQKKIARAIIHAQEQERNRIGQELHDNVNQILAATKIFLTSAAKSDEAKEAIKYPIQLIDNSINEIRSLSSSQVTPLKNIHLQEMIRELIDKMKENGKLNAVFDYNDHEDQMDDDLKLNIYRIIQEQLNNIIKYAAAANVLVSIRTQNNGTHILVSDDGRGFDTGIKRKGIGISNMINRVEAFNGSINIDSTPGKGCRVSVTLPVSGYIRNPGTDFTV